MNAVSYFICTSCGFRIPADEPAAVCPRCAGVMTPSPAAGATPERPGNPAERSVWRYAEALPQVQPLTLGEGGTPLLSLPGLPRWKRESLSVCGIAASRGLAVAVAALRGEGHARLSISASGVEAAACSAYAAAAGLALSVYLPVEEPLAVERQCALMGSTVQRGANPDAGAWTDLSSRTHPLRLEGDKTLAFEIAEQLGWELPDVVIAPSSCTAALTAGIAHLIRLEWVQAKVCVVREALPAASDTAARYWAARGLLLSSTSAGVAAAYEEMAEGRHAQSVVLVEEENAAQSPLRLLPVRMAVGGIITPQ